MQVSIGFCSRCGNQLNDGERECQACGADTVEANVIVVLKRVSARRSRPGRDGDADDDKIYPF